MELKDRIEQIIKANSITKTEFAKRIEVSQAFVSQMCSGAASPSDRTIALICQQFGISRDWLKYGKEPMKASVSEEEEKTELVDRAMKGTSGLKKAVIKMICSRTDDELAVLADALTEVYNQINKEKERQEKPPTLKKVAARGDVDQSILDNANTYIQLPDMESDILP